MHQPIASDPMVILARGRFLKYDRELNQKLQEAHLKLPPRIILI